MGFELPNNMDDLIYFTRRTIGEKGKVMAWVPKEICKKCNKGLVAKPKDEKTGRPKIRATEYVCNDCGESYEKESYEESLYAYVIYTCPHCGKSGEVKTPFKRKSIAGVKTLRVQCEHCGGNIDITKKMAEPKKKKSKTPIELDD
ncbi:MAG: hypothetical protein AB7V77_01825 [Candidatus Woesearchaeota archaeon]